MTLLATVTADLRNRHAVHPDFPQGILHGVEPGGLNDRFKFRHSTQPLLQDGIRTLCRGCKIAPLHLLLNARGTFLISRFTRLKCLLLPLQKQLQALQLFPPPSKEPTTPRRKTRSAGEVLCPARARAETVGVRSSLRVFRHLNESGQRSGNPATSDGEAGAGTT